MIEDYEKNLENWLNRLNWKENPFTLKIDPLLYVGYQDQLKRLINHIREGHKVALITGSTGSGKTTTLKLMERDLDSSYEVIYISKPPRKEDLVDIFLSRFRPSILQRIFGVNVSLHNLHVYLNKKLGQKRLLVLLDETHEADVDVLKWFRTLCDQIEGMQLIMAGLSTVDVVLKDIETLRSRIITHIELLNLTREDSRELIKKRIESVGGNDISPFTDNCVKEIYQITGGFPREVLKICDKLVQKAIEENRMEINRTEGLKCETSEPGEPEEAVPAYSGGPETAEKEEKGPPSKDFVKSLPYKQRKIILLLSEEGELFPSELAEKLGIEKYKSKQHAVRSVNNILKRLSGMGYVDRKPRGKGFVYSLNLKTKNLLIKS